MEFLNYKDLANEKNIEVLTFQKNLFDLRLKKVKNEPIKTHLFKKFKAKIAQLQFHKYLLLKA